MCRLTHFPGRVASLQPPPNFERSPGRRGADGGWDTVRMSLTPPTKEEMEELGPFPLTLRDVFTKTYIKETIEIQLR